MTLRKLDTIGTILLIGLAIAACAVFLKAMNK